jgi:BRCT domain type II-containing protein
MKFFGLFFMMLATSMLSAQSQQEKKAQKFTDEITKVLNLNEVESKAIYKIQLERFTENQAIEKEHGNNPELKKEKLKALGDKTFNQMKSVLGAERQKKWKEYKENN